MKKFMLALLLLVIAVGYSQTVIRQNDSTFVYQCVTTSGTDFNFIGLPLETGWTKASDFDPSGINMEAVTRWETPLQKFQTAVYSPVFGWCKDITVQTGQSYCINAKNNFDFTVTGDSIKVIYNLLTTSGTDMNQIVHPVTKSNLTTSAMLGNDIGTANCNAISHWNVITQTAVTSTYLINQWINSFNINVGKPLFINMKTNYIWPVVKNSDSGNSTTASNLKTKGSLAGARIVFFHITEESGRELTEAEMKLIQFDALITARPAEILNENSYDCGFMKINGMSALYVNLGNFPSIWNAGEQLNINSTNFTPMEGFGLSLELDSLGTTVYKGFEAQIPGSGNPWPVDMNAIIPLTGVDLTVREESGNIILDWTDEAGFNIYKIYSSDYPYGTFNYVTTTSNISWSTAASENRKFFYVVKTNEQYPTPPKTINVKEKK